MGIVAGTTGLLLGIVIPNLRGIGGKGALSELTRGRWGNLDINVHNSIQCYMPSAKGRLKYRSTLAFSSL